MRILEKLLEVAATTYQKFRVLLSLISSRFDYNPSAMYMPVDLWVSAQREIDQLLLLAITNPQYSVEESNLDYDELMERSPQTEAGGIVRVRGSIISFVDRLDDEFTKSLQNLDPHGTEYVDRLKDEKSLYVTICLCQIHYEKSSQQAPLFRVLMRRLEHIYSKVRPTVCSIYLY
jgi:translation initiation factor 3 subunit C